MGKKDDKQYDYETSIKTPEEITASIKMKNNTKNKVTFVYLIILMITFSLLTSIFIKQTPIYNIKSKNNIN